MKLMIALDVDAAPEEVLDAARPWLAALQGTVDLVYVSEARMEIPSGTSPASQLEFSAWQAARRAEDRTLSSLMATLPAAQQGVVRVLPGRAQITLVPLTRDYDLVLTGTRDRSKLARIMLGSVASTLIESAHCAVLVLRH